jgi:hypothetical protein
LHHILDLKLQLLLRPQQPLPDLITHHAPRQQRTQRLLPRPDLNDAADVFLCAGEQRCAEDGVWDFGGLFTAAAGVVGEVEEREVDVALRVWGEVGC